MVVSLASGKVRVEQMLTLRALWKAFRAMVRENARDDIFAGLVKVGINAQIAERGREEERIGGAGSYCQTPCQPTSPQPTSPRRVQESHRGGY